MFYLDFQIQHPIIRFCDFILLKYTRANLQFDSEKIPGSSSHYQL